MSENNYKLISISVPGMVVYFTADNYLDIGLNSTIGNGKNAYYTTLFYKETKGGIAALGFLKKENRDLFNKFFRKSMKSIFSKEYIDKKFKDTLEIDTDYASVICITTFIEKGDNK